MAWNPLVLYDAAGKAPSIGFPSAGSSTGFDWNNVANQAFNAFNTFFTTRRAVQAAPYTGQFYPTPQLSYNNNQLTAEQQQYLLAQQRNQSDVSGSINSLGIRIGNSVISWPTIGVGVLAVVLLQSHGWQRRSH